MKSLTDFFDAALRYHNDVILLPATRKVSGNDFVPAGQCSGTLRRARATAELLGQEKPNFLVSKLWPPISKQPRSELWITRFELSCSIVSTTDSVDELKRRLIDVWCGLEQSIFDKTID